MAKLWKLMTEMYGHKFTSSYGDAPNDTWALGLAGISQQEIIQGVKRCLKREDTWPPTLPEFIKLCRPPRPSLPKSNYELTSFASQHGLPGPRAGETYPEYRARLKAELDRPGANIVSLPKPGEV